VTSLIGAYGNTPLPNNGRRIMLLNTLENILQEVDMERGYQLLTPRERNIINLYYLEGYKDKEIASHYGVTRQNIFKIRKNGMIKLKKKIIF
jgi:RNA polymerase sigma factor (sigma-70 family)